jgi:hypothetical protein
MAATHKAMAAAEEAEHRNYGKYRIQLMELEKLADEMNTTPAVLLFETLERYKHCLAETRYALDLALSGAAW